MPEQYQCDNCGAVLTEDDLFCGECGAPQPESRPAPKPVAPGPTFDRDALAVPSAPPAATKPGRLPDQWRTVAIIVATLAIAAAVLLCAGGLFTAFLVEDAETGLTATQDMFIFSGLCCFCPGALAVILAIVLWVLAIRRK